jgi:uncharacterized cupredoxin-like copper-binding protein
MKRKALMLTGLCALAVSLAQAGLRPALAHATPRARLTTTTVKVSMHNSSFILSANSAPRGVVIFKLHATLKGNTARYPHDFSINGHTSKLIRPGQSATLRVTFSRKGGYRWRCTFDHHASTGEKGVFTIT